MRARSKSAQALLMLVFLDTEFTNFCLVGCLCTVKGMHTCRFKIKKNCYMNFATKTISVVLLLLAALLSTGCGGGGSDEYTVTCKDGWISHSKDRQGACSSHGGVSG